MNASNVAAIALANAMTKRADAVWAPGTNQGGRFHASLADGTLHFYVIKNPTTGAVDAGVSDNSINPTVGANYPAGFSLFRRVWSGKRVAGVIKPYTQFGDKGLWVTPVADLALTSIPTTATSLATSVPTGITVEASLTVALGLSATGLFVRVFSSYSADISITGGI